MDFIFFAIAGIAIFLLIKEPVASRVNKFLGFKQGSSMAEHNRYMESMSEFIKALHHTTAIIEKNNDLNLTGQEPDTTSLKDAIANLMALYANEQSAGKKTLVNLPEWDKRKDTLLDILRGLCIEQTGTKETGEKMAVEKIDLALMDLDAQEKLLFPDKVRNPAKAYF